MKPEDHIQNRSGQIEQSKEHVYPIGSKTIQQESSNKLADNGTDVAANYIVGRNSQAFASRRCDAGNVPNEFHQYDPVDRSLGEE